MADRIRLTQENTGRRETLQLGTGDRTDDRIEVVDLTGSHVGTLVRDNAGWTYYDADFDRVVSALREDVCSLSDEIGGSGVIVEEVRA